MRWLIPFFVGLCAVVPASVQAAPPNIVLILSDDHRWTDYGFMGHKTIETPRLDQLAARSALFRAATFPPRCVDRR